MSEEAKHIYNMTNALLCLSGPSFKNNYMEERTLGYAMARNEIVCMGYADYISQINILRTKIA